MNMSETKPAHPAIRPRGKYVLLRIEKREMTQSGIVIAGTARGYDVIRVIAKGPHAGDDLPVGALVQLYPGSRSLITFDEHPDYAMAEDDQIICVDERDESELLGAQERKIALVTGETLQ